MPKTIYLDTNQFVRIFERESEVLFPRFARAIVQNDWALVVSEGNVLEVFQGIAKGANLDAVLKGLELVESLRPRWLCISGLDVEELRSAFVQFESGTEFTKLNPFRSWPEFLAAILRSRDMSVMIDLAMSGVSEAFRSLYASGRIGREDRHRYWQGELDAAAVTFRNSIQGPRRNIAIRENFIETVIHTCRAISENERQLREFAERLWDSAPTCPGFRLNFEATASPLGDHQYAWTTNRFYDQRHLIAIPYVDLFVGLDRGQRHTIREFDRRIGVAAGISYSPRCHALIEDVLPV